MKNILSYLAFSSLVFAQCTQPPKEFSNYDINPLRESIVNNNVTAYVVYEFVGGKLEKGDSVSFDRQGNIKSIIDNGKGWRSEHHFLYDSLNRLVYETQQSDIFNKVWTEYKLNTGTQTVVKYISIGSRGDTVGKLIRKELLKFDIDLNKILTKTDLDISSHDTIFTRYEYEGDKIKREVEEANGQQRRVIDYIYDNGQLTLIKRQRSRFSIIQYLSKTTGLIDSTSMKTPNEETIEYYKYYH